MFLRNIAAWMKMRLCDKHSDQFSGTGDLVSWRSYVPSGRRAEEDKQIFWYTGDRLLRPCYLSREDHNRKIRSRKQRTDIGKYLFVNRTIINWNQLPADLLVSFPCKLNSFRKRVKKVVTNKEIKWGLNVNACVYCVLSCHYFYTLYCIVLTFYCIVHVLLYFYIILYCVVIA
jgi:hypothetical protein